MSENLKKALKHLDSALNTHLQISRASNASMQVVQETFVIFTAFLEPFLKEYESLKKKVKEIDKSEVVEKT